MVDVKFNFEESASEIFGTVWRQVAKVGFWSRKIRGWVDVIMIIDTGADYTILPRFYAADLGVNLHKECVSYRTFGIGGSEKVYLLKNAKVKLGKWERFIPVGFINRENVPPLLGRQEFLETFKITLMNHATSFSLA